MCISISHTPEDEHSWPEKNWKDFLGPIIQKVFAHLNYNKPDAWVSVLLTNDDYITTLNSQYRHKNSPTNVLSFPLSDDPYSTCLGDIALSFDTIKREAEEQQKSLEAHITHMVVHGVLHLLSFDHETEDDALIMEGHECHILNQLGYTNPYLDSNA